MEQAKSIANYFEQTLARLLYAEEVAVEDLNVISEQDWRRICQFNSVPPESPNRCIHEVIYEQTLLRPEREAVCSWDGSLTYRELDLQASKVAAYLLEHGVKPETSVAVCFDKSVRSGHLIFLRCILNFDLEMVYRGRSGCFESRRCFRTP